MFCRQLRVCFSFIYLEFTWKTLNSVLKSKQNLVSKSTSSMGSSLTVAVAISDLSLRFYKLQTTFVMHTCYFHFRAEVESLESGW